MWLPSTTWWISFQHTLMWHFWWKDLEPLLVFSPLASTPCSSYKQRWRGLSKIRNLSQTQGMHDLPSLSPSHEIFSQSLRGCIVSGRKQFWTAKPCRIADTVCVQPSREVVVSIFCPRGCSRVLPKGCLRDRPRDCPEASRRAVRVTVRELMRENILAVGRL